MMSIGPYMAHTRTQRNNEMEKSNKKKINWMHGNCVKRKMMSKKIEIGQLTTLDNGLDFLCALTALQKYI